MPISQCNMKLITFDSSLKYLRHKGLRFLTRMRAKCTHRVIFHFDTDRLVLSMYDCQLSSLIFHSLIYFTLPDASKILFGIKWDSIQGILQTFATTFCSVNPFQRI